MNKYIKCVVCWGMVSMALLSSCNDEWDSHYESDGGVPGVSLMDLLRRDSRLENRLECSGIISAHCSLDFPGSSEISTSQETGIPRPVRRLFT